MKHHLRFTAALLLQGLRVTHDRLAEILGLSTEQHYEFRPFTRWGFADDAFVPGYRKCFYEDPDGWAWCMIPAKVLDWGPWTVVVESAQDGGGTTRFFRKFNELPEKEVLRLRDDWENPESPAEADRDWDDLP